MKFLIIVLSLCLSSTIFSSEIYKQKIKAPKNKEIHFSDFKNKPFLIVNIATKCGYTGQLDDLQKLYSKYQEKGLVVIGVPSNDFAGQTPENNEEVSKICRLKYGVNFPISNKVKIVGDQKHSLINTLLRSSQREAIDWNFEKFLFDKNGKFVKRFSSSESPLGSKIEEEIVKLVN